MVLSTKTCSQCAIDKPLSEFHRGYKRADGTYSPFPMCKPCRSEWNKDWRSKQDPEKLRDWNTRYRKTPEQKRRENLRKRGWTVDLYDEAYERQGGRCAICDEWRERLEADHDHATMRPRELLCGHCNTMLGRARDSIKNLAAGIRYLEKHS